VLLIAEVRLGAGCELAGQPVSAVDQPGRCRVVGVVGVSREPAVPERRPAVPNHRLPDPERRLQSGDVMLIAATRAGLTGVLIAAQGRA
jgi:Trk K+ transport system NAD-binding subunit